MYPGPERIDNTTDEFVIPATCTNYTNWPYGADSPPAYMSRWGGDMINNRYINRKIDYLLGEDDIVTTGTLNTEDCEAILLGKNRFQRGANMYDYMSKFHADSLMHSKTVVPEVGHDGQFMFNSTTALSLVNKFLEQ